jgi:tRNA modification GTPase
MSKLIASEGTFIGEIVKQDTIAAIATPVGSGGIGIIRISGPLSGSILETLFRKETGSHAGCLNKETPFSRRLTHGFIIDPHNDELVDEVLVSFMRAPNSYTCENVGEIQSHCGPVVLKKILNLVLSYGARLADPGEFTKRAFLNGRIDLSQAESIADMISARTDAALNLAVAQLKGEMAANIAQPIEFIHNNIVSLQAVIEFDAELEESMEWPCFYRDLRSRAIEPIKRLLLHYENGHVLRDGVRLDIVGRPNVGKSSLLNKLINKDKAIVTSIPGTTRDLIEDFFSVRGIPIIITDTAGLHRTNDPVEIIGIEKTRRAIAQSDLILCVIDATDPFNGDDYDVINSIDKQKTILVLNKMDLVESSAAIKIPKAWEGIITLQISAKTGEGIEDLKNCIAERFKGGLEIDFGQSLVPSVRQKLLLESALETLKRVDAGQPFRIGEELIVYELERALNDLRKITGEVVDEQVMDEVFNRFCIGK